MKECRLALLELLTSPIGIPSQKLRNPGEIFFCPRIPNGEVCPIRTQKNLFTYEGQLYWLFALHKNSVCFRYLLLVQNVVHQFSLWKFIIYKTKYFRLQLLLYNKDQKFRVSTIGGKREYSPPRKSKGKAKALIYWRLFELDTDRVKLVFLNQNYFTCIENMRKNYIMKMIWVRLLGGGGLLQRGKIFWGP